MKNAYQSSDQSEASGIAPKDLARHKTWSPDFDEATQAAIGEEAHTLNQPLRQQHNSEASLQDYNFKFPNTHSPVPKIVLEHAEENLPHKDSNAYRQGSGNAGPSRLASDLAHPLTRRPPESEASGLSFENIETVTDRGTTAHHKWEQSRSDVSMHSRQQEHASSSHNGSGRAAGRNRRRNFIESISHGPKTSIVSSSARITVESVCEDIIDQFEISKFDDRKYLPLDRLCEILTPEVIYILLSSRKFGHGEALRLQKEVINTPRCHGRRRIFAILIIIDKIERLRKFVELKLDDASLPLTSDQLNKSFRSNDDSRKYSTAWTSKTSHDFIFYQQTIHVPFFSFTGHQICYYELDHESTLPFCDYKQHASGGYGTVRRAGIHHAHHDHSGSPKDKVTRHFAVKRLHVPNSEDYLKEVNIFDKLGIKKAQSMANHLIPLQMTYKHGNDFFLVFPWADGNLKEFWKSVRPDPANPARLYWFLDQCWGIAHGLRKIHHLSTLSKDTFDKSNAQQRVLTPIQGDKEWGRHGDIKPENILWFKKYEERQDYLVISDFGLTRFNSAQSRSKVLQDKIEGFSGTYRPPDLHLDDEKISPRYDIWSFGCVLLEFTSWFLLGYYETIEVFASKRSKDKLERDRVSSEDTFFGLIKETEASKGRYRAEVKDSVIEWIERLRRTDHCTTPLLDLLNLIQYRMLVIDSQSRWTSGKVSTELGILYRTYAKDSTIGINGTRASNPVDDIQAQTIHTSSLRSKSTQDPEYVLHNGTMNQTKATNEEKGSEKNTTTDKVKSVRPISKSNNEHPTAFTEPDNHETPRTSFSVSYHLMALFDETPADDANSTHSTTLVTEPGNIQGDIRRVGAQFDAAYDPLDENTKARNSMAHLTDSDSIELRATVDQPSSKIQGQVVTSDRETSNQPTHPGLEPVQRPPEVAGHIASGVPRPRRRKLLQKMMGWVKKKAARR